MRVLVIGGDAAGMTAASQVRRRQPDWDVVVLEKGRFVSYAACGIPYAIGGEVRDRSELEVFPAERFRSERRIDLRTGWRVTAIDTERKTVRAVHGGGEEQLNWDRLLLATGAKPILPPWPGRDLRGVASVRNLEDLAHLEELLADAPEKAVVIGAGYVGLEMAEALHRRGLSVTVLERADGVMGGVHPKVTELVQHEVAGRCELRLGQTVTGFQGVDGKLQRVLVRGGAFDADLAVVALGVRPRSELAEAAGIRLGATGAIAVDERQRTSAEDVWAAGDCAESKHRVTGEPVWIPLALGANRSGRVAGAVMAGGDATFPGVLGSAVTRVCELGVARTGLTLEQAKAAGLDPQAVESTAPHRAHYIVGHEPVWVQLVFERGSRRLLGALLAGRDPGIGKRADIVATAISAGMTIDDFADLDLTYAPVFSPVWDPVLKAANRAMLGRD